MAAWNEGLKTHELTLDNFAQKGIMASTQSVGCAAMGKAVMKLSSEQFAPGHFDLTSPAGTASASTDSQIGSLDFQSLTGFTHFTLAAFTTDNAPIPMGIDNLVMTVPEPAPFSIAGLGVATLTICRRRKTAVANPR
jgi:hypothetical protein